MPKTVTADLGVVETATAEQPPKRAKTLRLSLKSKPSPVEADAGVEQPSLDLDTADAQVAEIAAPAVVETPDPGPVLSPAERREAILRRLREEGDTTVPPRREAGDQNALPAFRYPVNRFAR